MSDEFLAAKTYDQMINWESRLEREIPVISAYFDDLGEHATILDVACSSGRHSFALNKMKFQTVGIDISPHFIQLAKDLSEAQEMGKLSHFLELDASSDALLDEFEGRYFDGAILLGNAIANMGNFVKGKSLLQNIFILLRPGGKLFVQTVNKPLKPWYNPLRKKDNVIIQRIMVPEPISDQESNANENTEPHEHNVTLHVNQIDPETLQYLQQKNDNHFFMYRLHEFERLVKRVGFDVEAVESGYSGDEVRDEDGETLIWKLQKPEINLTGEGIELFERYAGIDEMEIKKRTLSIWQALIRQQWYRCTQSYRFLYPRILAHPNYEQIIEEKQSEAILDLACHIGTDLRQMYVDGARELYGLDISDVLIEKGKELYGDHNKDNITFYCENIMDDEVLSYLSYSDARDLDDKERGESTEPKGDALNNPQFVDRGAVSGKFASFLSYFGVIHAGSLIHLLEKDEILRLCERVYLLLDKNGVFFGRTVGSVTAGKHMDGLRFLHSIDSLRTTLNLVGFSDIEVFEMPRGGPIGESSNSTVLQIGFYARK